MYTYNIRSENHENRYKILTRQIRNKFNVLIIEIESNELWQIATIGIGVISNKITNLNQTIENIISFIESSNHEVNIISNDTDIIT